jgi:hypothetical protein
MATLIEELGCTPHAANMVANDLTTARKHGLKAIPLGPFDLGYEYLLCGLCADWRGPGLQGEAVHPECLAEALRDDQPRRVQDVPDPAGRFS